MIWKPRVTVAAVIERDGRYLCVEEKAEDGRSVFNQPAGHLEAGESLLDAVRREVLEETCREFEPSHLVGIYRWVTESGVDTYLRFTFAGTVGEVLPGCALDPDIQRTVWLSRAELAADPTCLRSPLVMQSVADAESGRCFPLDILRDLG